MKFELESLYQPQGDQPSAIAQLVKGLNNGLKEQVLLGATGTGKTFTAANLIEQVQKPTLVLAHNKTLAAQLYSEFKIFFPKNAIHYFVSYFDYYQPEAYKPQTDTYIEKDSAINEEIDRLRHAATSALLTRRDVLIVASVSCIYGLGSVEHYQDLSIEVNPQNTKSLAKLVRRLTDIQYQRNDVNLVRGCFRLKGDVLDIYPSNEDQIYRLDFFGDQLERIRLLDGLTYQTKQEVEQVVIFPCSHYVTPEERLKSALGQIKLELAERLKVFKVNNQLLEAQRLEQRTRHDIEMIEETGFVKGIENYSRFLTDREAGQQPATLLDYFPDDYLLLIDESHITIPQVRGMYEGDRSRKQTLVDYGFRLPSALDNRPLNFEEFENHVNQVVYISATPGQYELTRSPMPVEQIIRPTGLLDPEVEVRPSEGQIDDLLNLVQARIAVKQRVLITTLTKRMAEDLTDHLKDLNLKVQYLHSDIKTLERSTILRDLRKGAYDVLVGINLLREGLDLPEVSLVVILDADKEGFLRSGTSLIQTIGRAARHKEGLVVMYADEVTQSMDFALKETKRRRKIQQAYNKKHNITPQSINKDINESLTMADSYADEIKSRDIRREVKSLAKEDIPSLREQLTQEMYQLSADLDFEKAAEIRDYLKLLDEKI